MASTSIADLIQSIADDDQVRQSFRRAALSGRDAVRQATGRAKPAKKTSALRRAGESLQQFGKGLTAIGGRAQKQQKRSKPARGLPVALGAAAAAAGIAALVTRNSGGTQTTTGGTNG